MCYCELWMSRNGCGNINVISIFEKADKTGSRKAIMDVEKRK